MLPERLAHYRIVRSIGAGGMGEVYLAEDTKLGRKVALKVLTPALAHDPDRRERFEREARAVAALNHPNIVTLHAVEQHEGVLFLTMELVDGRPLDQLIPARGMALEQLLHVAVPLVDAVAAAHQKGITHRDLKPANVMVTEDDRVKVLDFGLAKLHEPEAFGADTTMTAANVTGEGRIMGTCAYMSPEQAQGKAVDGRSDIFSLGIVIYEMGTGERPFKGDNHVSVLSAILKDVPASLSDIRQDLPRDLARIVRRCLAKNPEERYQSAKDLRNDLKLLKQDLESGAIARDASRPVTGSASGSAAAATTVRTTRARIAIAAAALLVLAAIAGTWWYKGRAQYDSSPQLADLKMRRLTNTGTASLAAISPDGRYVVHVVGGRGQQSLWMRQVSTQSNVQIVAPAPGAYAGLAFTPDSEAVVYLFYPPGRPGLLYRIPFLGGTATKLIEDVDTAPAFSPDGTRMAVVRGTTDGTMTILLLRSDGRVEKELATRKSPDHFATQPLAWSPDGRHLAAFVGGMPWSRSRVVAVDVATGTADTLGEARFDFGGRLNWLPDGSGVVFDAVEQGQGIGSAAQLWTIAYPEGTARRLTHDIANYSSLSVARDGRTLAAVQEEGRLSLWIAPGGDASKARPLTPTSTGRDGMVGMDWTPDGRIVYTSMANGTWDLWIIATDGSPPAPLTTQPGVEAAPSVLPDGSGVAFVARVPGDRFTLHALSFADGHLAELHEEQRIGPGQVHVGAEHVYYRRMERGRLVLYRVPRGGGEPQLAAPGVGSVLPGFVASRISPDERWVLGSAFDPSRQGRVLVAAPLARPGPPRIIPFPFEAGPSGFGLGWAPDSQAVEATVLQDGAVNVWRFPLDGSAPRPITAFTSEHIFSYAWSKDGKTLALSRGTVSADVVLISAGDATLSN